MSTKTFEKRGKRASIIHQELDKLDEKTDAELDIDEENLKRTDVRLETAPKRIDRDVLLRAADHLAEKLEVTEEYKKFKDVDFLKVSEKKSTYEEDCYSIVEDIMKENV